MQLVEVQKNEVFASSEIVARKFKYQHSNLVKTIRKLMGELEKLTPYPTRAKNNPKTKEIDKEYRGSKFKAFLMNREFFSLLVMRLRGKNALEWQLKFNDAFYEMERKLFQLSSNKNNPEWLEARFKGKAARLSETDAIKVFIDYATEQGSKSAKYYYKHFTNMSYGALGLMTHKKPQLRDTLEFIPLCELVIVEEMIKNLLVKYMRLNRHYKDIYQSIKEDLIKFSNGLHMAQMSE